MLDLGCGWGNFAHYAAVRYGVEVVGVTLSRQPAVIARERCLGLPVEIRIEDYREVRGRFDRTVAIGIFEHVGHENYWTFMDIIARCLADDGYLLLLLLSCAAATRTRYSQNWQIVLSKGTRNGCYVPVR